MVSIGNSWDEILKDEFSGENYLKIREFLKDEYSHHVCYPSMYDIFNALKYTDYYAVKAVIIGQDPYHEEGQAHGLSFSVKKGVDIPPSLVNIYKELKSDLGISPAPHGCLESWAKQGVLLLNSVLTVRAHRQYRVQKKHALLCPTFKTAVRRGRNAQIAFQLLVNIDKRRRNIHSFFHRKGKPVSLPFFVIRVLSDYHRFDGVIIGVFQRVEYVVHRRIADVM